MFRRRCLDSLLSEERRVAGTKGSLGCVNEIGSVSLLSGSDFDPGLSRHRLVDRHPVLCEKAP